VWPRRGRESGRGRPAPAATLSGVPVDPYYPGYHGAPPPKTHLCGLCGGMNGGPGSATAPKVRFQQQAVWRGGCLCDSCKDGTIPVTFPRADANREGPQFSSSERLFREVLDDVE
jgi:hypothetical protein